MAYQFADRHNGPREADRQQMLALLGVSSLDELAAKVIPQDIRLPQDLDLDPALDEAAYLKKIKDLASKNKEVRSLIGMGYYGTATPAAIMRYVFANPGWYTSYTPYQAEISQGRLEALLNFQTMICSLTGFPLSNCSLLDESTAAAEAMRMMYELRPRTAVKEGRKRVFADLGLLPQTASVLATRARTLGFELVTGDFREFDFAGGCFGALVAYPAADGALHDFTEFAARAHEAGALVTAVCDPLALAVLKEPAAWGADIAVGSVQRFGLPLGFGGPHAGYMACREAYKRNIPGRIIGLSKDRLGNDSFRLALQMREQHIKRERATSNICTASALMAVMAGMYAVYHGSKGIKDIALNAYFRAHAVAWHLQKAGYRLRHTQFFDTLEVVDVNACEIKDKAEAAGFNFFYPEGGDSVRMSFDELSTAQESRAILKIFGYEVDGCDRNHPDFEALPEGLAREKDALQEKIFNTYHSELEFMRYAKRLENKDVSMTHSMIPLGSCTMKLNAAAEMIPLTWSEFANVHPYAPCQQVAGSIELVKELCHDLAVITGMHAVSLQPNSGAAGEYAGLCVIRAYLDAQGQQHRKVLIIPSSAHGTNPASAAMAGMQIVTVGCDANGNINVEELREKAQAHQEDLAGIMITYPSTHGVFEVKIREIVDTIHRCGGLVYMDGANMNAQVGLTSPGFIGADVCHLNLHKTFAMAHGGGGPGVGPICVTEALAPYLPGHPLVNPNKAHDPAGLQTAVSSAPFGSPLLLPVTYAYIKLLGAAGLKEATQVAILNANYLSKALAPYYKTLYTGATGFVAHECILDLQHFVKTYNVDATDIAKRLMDFGFHAPTLSFPVHETLMVEPTESESLEELDRFAQALRCILEECEALKDGRLDATDNPLKNAPHPVAEVCADAWSHPYPRSQAAWPLEWIRARKFWPGCARVDNGAGDRNLICCYPE